MAKNPKFGPFWAQIAHFWAKTFFFENPKTSLDASQIVWTFLLFLTSFLNLIVPREILWLRLKKNFWWRGIGQSKNLWKNEVSSMTEWLSTCLRMVWKYLANFRSGYRYHAHLKYVLWGLGWLKSSEFLHMCSRKVIVSVYEINSG